MEQQIKLKTGPLAIEGIKHFESLHDGDLTKIGLQPKMDPIGIWTVGYGHALTNAKTGKFLKGDSDRDQAYRQYPNLSENDALNLLRGDLVKYENMTLQMLTNLGLTNDQFGALVSFCYNCGTHYKNKVGQLKPYAIWANVNAFNPNDPKSRESLREYWKTSVITSGGKVMGGLQKRRAWEANLFLDGVSVFGN